MNSSLMLTTSPSPELTMSSREIAELTGKDHKNVLADIRKMLTELGHTLADFSANLFDSYGRSQKGFNLPKRETYILMAGYSTPLRAKIIDRWQELEATTRHQDPIQVLNDPVAMRGLLLTYTEKVLALEATNAELTEEVQEQAEQIADGAPKIETFNRFMDTSRTIGVRELSNILHVSERKLVDWLITHNWAYRDQTSGRLRPKPERLKSGHLYLHECVTGYGYFPQFRVTPKGIVHLDRVLPPVLRFPQAA